MKRTICAGVLAVAAACCLADSPAFTLSSPDIPSGGNVPNEHVFNQGGCNGVNLSPALRWTHAPTGTRSFAVTVFDRDEKITGSGWWHWIVYDIPASSRGLAKGAGAERSSSLPGDTVQGRSDLGTAAYHGPCPEPGQSHRYVFTVYALKIDKLPVERAATPAMVRFVLNDFILGEAAFSATASR
jgi:Raf kinase inhibitor-like YbhB/YbcL family protein